VARLSIFFLKTLVKIPILGLSNSENTHVKPKNGVNTNLEKNLVVLE